MERDRSSVLVALSVRGVALQLIWVAAALVALDLLAVTFTQVTGHDHVRGLLPIIRLDKEANLGTLFQVGMMLCSAILFFGAGWRASAERRAARIWWFLGWVFVFLALDEQSWIHERLMGPMREVLPPYGLLHFGWIVPYGLLVILLSFVVGPFILGLAREVRRWFIWSAATYLTGAFGIEALGGWRLQVIGGESARPELVYELLTTVEESLEMTGLILLIVALLELLRLSYPERRLQLVK